MRYFALSLALITVLLSGCSSYMFQSDKTMTVTQPISKSVFSVSFCGNAYMAYRDAEKYAMQRACELTITKGFTHFLVLDKSDRSEICSLGDRPKRPYSPGMEEGYPEAVSGEGTLMRPNVTLKIQCFGKMDAPAEAIDAQKYLDENFPGLKFK